MNYPKMRPDLFWLVVGLVVLAAFLSSCSSNFYCKHCPKRAVKDSVHVELRDSIVPRDSIVLIPRDSFTIVFKDSVPCKDFEATKQDSKGNKATVTVHNGELHVDCKCEDAKIKLQWFEHHYKQIIANYHSEVNTITAKKTGFQRFKDYYFWTTAILLALFITYRILKVTGR